MEKYTLEEISIRAKLDDLLAIRREYMKSAFNSQELKAAGNRAFEALETSIRNSVLPPNRTKRQTKKKARKE